MRDYALIYLNGTRKEVRGPEALSMTAEWLRKEVGLTGTKIVCAEGDCGACSILRSFPTSKNPEPAFEAMNSCIALVAQLDGSFLVTVEGIQEGGELSPAQKAMKECHGSQCGYCTPGFVVALTGALEKHEALDAKTACNYLTGNLCRCTGYQPIIEAAVKAKKNPNQSIFKRYFKQDQSLELQKAQRSSLGIETAQATFLAPATLLEAVQFAQENPGFKVLGAATDLGVQTNKGKPLPQALLSLHLIPELYEIKAEGKTLVLGARVSFAKVRRAVEKRNPEFGKFLDLFASPQIKNVATLVGNIANASPIGDSLPFLLVSGGKVRTAKLSKDKKGIETREIPMTELYLGYKKLSLEAGEIITHVSFEATSSHEVLKLYKVSQRKDLDISTVSAAFSLKTKKEGKKIFIEEAKLAFGGVAATPIRFSQAEKVLNQSEFNRSKAEETLRVIQKELKPLDDLRGSASYRKVLAANLFKKYADEVLHG